VKTVRNCPICGNSRFRFLGAAKPGTGLHTAQVICRECRLIISQPQANVAEMNDHYRNVYYQQIWKEDTIELDSSRSHLRVIYELIGETISGKRVLDVGCGYGKMLRVLNDLGNQCYGCDISEKAVQYAIDNFDLRGVRCGDIASFRGEIFDVVLSFHTIEHLPEPRMFCRDLVALAAPGGLVIVGTENARYCQAFLERNLSALSGRGKPFFTSQEHTFVFETTNIRRLLSDCGLEDVRSMAYHVVPATFGTAAKESLHWAVYKKLCRMVDRWSGGLGPYLVAAGRRPFGARCRVNAGSITL